MKVLKSLFAVLLLCSCGSRNFQQTLPEADVNILEKASILYMRSFCFSDMFVGRCITSEILYTGGLDTIDVTGQDTLSAIRDLIDLTDADTLKRIHDDAHYYGPYYENEVCPWFIVLLSYKNDRIDTLALPESPLDVPGAYKYQYNNLLKKNTDAKLFDYISNIVRSRDPYWKEWNEDYYKDGRYHDKPNDLFSD